MRDACWTDTDSSLDFPFIVFIRWCNICSNDVFRHYRRKEIKLIVYMKKKHAHLRRQPTVAIVPWMVVRREWNHIPRFLQSTVNRCERSIWTRPAPRSNKGAVTRNAVRSFRVRKVNNISASYSIIVQTCTVTLYRPMSTNLSMSNRPNAFVRHPPFSCLTCPIQLNTPLICCDYCIKWSNTKQRLFSNTFCDDIATNSTIIFILLLEVPTSNWKPMNYCRISNLIVSTMFSLRRTARTSIRWPPVYVIERTIH